MNGWRRHYMESQPRCAVSKSLRVFLFFLVFGDCGTLRRERRRERERICQNIDRRIRYAFCPNWYSIFVSRLCSTSLKIFPQQKIIITKNDLDVDRESMLCYQIRCNAEQKLLNWILKEIFKLYKLEINVFICLKYSVSYIPSFIIFHTHTPEICAFKDGSSFFYAF